MANSETSRKIRFLEIDEDLEEDLVWEDSGVGASFKVGFMNQSIEKPSS
jgi:hypothetical protein